MDRRQRIANADETYQLIKVIHALEGTNFEQLMGSGIMVQLTPITEGNELGGEFMVRAEDIGPVADLLVASIRESLRMRAAMLRRELKDIEQATAE